jgi:hypothetical protein
MKKIESLGTKNKRITISFKKWDFIFSRNETEKKHWVNEMQKRGKDFYSLAISFKNIAFLFCFSFSCKYISINRFNLK